MSAGGRGIGRACAIALAREGAGIILTSRHEEQLKEVALSGSLLVQNEFRGPSVSLLLEVESPLS